MRRTLFLLLTVALAAAVHMDWHLARPTHHRLSLGWTQHWLFAATICAALGWTIARRWPENPWRAAAGIVGLGLLMGQVLEPVLEVAFYEHRIGYPRDPDRLEIFGAFVAAGIPALILALRLGRPTRKRASVRMTADSLSE